ncbi:hypothetical protein TNCV_5082891 [Trichonephila clavipes]|nr:hypothetical protein TNCV_5082891 [Trichonephila clavipes]
MLGMAKVVVFILLSGMTVTARPMGSERRGYGTSSGCLFKGGLGHDTKVTCDVESFLRGRSRDNYYTFGSNRRHVDDFGGGGSWGNCAGYLTVSCIKGGQMLTSPRTYASGCPAWDLLPRETT